MTRIGEGVSATETSVSADRVRAINVAAVGVLRSVSAGRAKTSGRGAAKCAQTWVYEGVGEIPRGISAGSSVLCLMSGTGTAATGDSRGSYSGSQTEPAEV